MKTLTLEECARCQKWISNYIVHNDEAYCEDCADELQARFEAAYESAREDGLV